MGEQRKIYFSSYQNETVSENSKSFVMSLLNSNSKYNFVAKTYRGQSDDPYRWEVRTGFFVCLVIEHIQMKTKYFTQSQILSTCSSSALFCFCLVSISDAYSLFLK